jgi:hypothetical protein
MKRQTYTYKKDVAAINFSYIEDDEQVRYDDINNFSILPVLAPDSINIEINNSNDTAYKEDSHFDLEQARSTSLKNGGNEQMVTHL